MGKIQDETLRLNIVVNGNTGQKALGELESANRKLTNSNEDLRKAKQRLISEGKKETQEYKNITKEMTKNSLEIKENKTKMGALRKEIGITALTTKQLRQEQTRLKTILASTTPNTEAYKKYEKQLQAVNSRLGELNGRIKKTGGIIGKIKSSFGGLGSIIAGAFSVAAVIKFANVVVDSVNELKKVKSTLQQITGLKGLALKKATVGIKGLADAYDKETKQMSEAVHNFSQGMEIDFNDALDLVKEGFIDGADANEEFLDKLREYPVLLKEAGFSAEESIALMTQEVKSGIYSDKGVDAIKEANLRLREMTPAAKEALEAIGISSEKVQEELTNGSKTTFDIMQQVSKKLSELPPQSAKVGQAIADIFGGPGEDAGLKYLANLQNINLETSKLTTSSNQYLEAKKLEIKANEAMNLVWLGLTGTGSSLNIMYSKLKIGVANLLGAQVSLVDNLKEEQVQANILITKLTDLNISEGDRQKIIEQLNTDYPKFVENIDLENASNEQLSTILGQINNQYINRIILQKKVDELNVLGESAANTQIYITEKKQESLETLAEAERKLGIEVDLNKSLTERRAIALAKAREETGLFQFSANKLVQTLQLMSNEDLTGIGGIHEESLNKKTAAFENLNAEIQKYREENGLLDETVAKPDVDDETVEGGSTKKVLTDQEKAAILKDLETFEKQKLQVKNELAIIAEKEDFERKRLKIQQDSNIREKEINALKISAEKKKELLDLNFEQEIVALDELNAEREEKELKAQQDLEDRKRELENEIALSNAATNEEREILKAEQDAEKVALEIERALLTQQEKDELLLLVKEQGLKAVENIEKKYSAAKTKKQKEDFKKELANRKNLQNDILNGAIDAAGRESKIGKALLAIKSLLAAKESLISLGVLKNKVVTTAAGAQADIAGGVATTAKVGFPQNIPLLIGFAAQVAGIISAIKSAASAGSQVKTSGFQDGYYPITRTDGKKFNAKAKSSSHTQLVTEPTYFSDANILTGEGGPEIIIDTPTLKNLDPEVVRNIYATAARTRGFESGLFPQTTNNNASLGAVEGQGDENITTNSDALFAFANAVNHLVDEGIDARAIIGDDEIKKLTDRSEKLKTPRNVAKINS